jgi:hypothetical protein
MLVRIVANGIGLGSEQEAADHIDLVALHQLAHFGDGGLGVGLSVFDNQIDVIAAELASLFLEIEFESLDHLQRAFRYEAAERNGQANFQRIRGGGAGNARGIQQAGQ